MNTIHRTALVAMLCLCALSGNALAQATFSSVDCAAIVPAPLNCIFWNDHPWIQDGEDADGVPDADDTVVLRHTVRVTDLSTIESDTFEIANLQLQVGGLAAIQNDSLLVVSGLDSTWMGGVLGVETNGSGSFEVASGATMRLSDMQITIPFAFETPRMALDEFRNRGTVQVSDASDVGFDNNVVFQNDGAFELQDDGNLLQVPIAGGAWPIFRNNTGAVLRKSGGTGTSRVETKLANTDAGIEVQSGRLELAPSYGFSSFEGADFTVAAGAVLDLTGGTGLGDSSTRYIEDGTFTGSGDGTVLLESGIITLSFDPDGTATTDRVVFDFPEGLFQWTGGSIVPVSGGPVLRNDGTITLAGSEAKELGGTLENAGVVRHGDTGDLAMRFGTRIENLSGGLYDIQGDAGMAPGGGGGAWPFFGNAGTLRKSAGSGNATLEFHSVMENSGTMEALEGGFEVIGRVTNQGTVRGLRAIEGDYTQTAEGTIRFDVSGLTEIRDLVVHQGYVTLAGTLEVAFLDGYAPMKDDTFVLITLDPGFSVTADALTISPLGLAPGAQFETAFDAAAGTYTLTALNDTTSDQPVLVSAVLPTSRSVQVGQAATAFATIINAGLKEATDCSIAPGNPLAADFLYQTTDPATNVLTGSPNQPVNIPGSNGSQSFLVALTPTTALDPTDIEFVFDCTNSDPAPTHVGVNTLLLVADSGPVPDIVALSATLTGDGIVNLANTGVFAVATVNVGIATTITVSADTGSASLPVSIALCETNPATAACINPTVPTLGPVITSIATNATPTFAFFLTGMDTVPFDPANNRIFVRFQDAVGVTRGSTSVAVQTL